MFGRLRKYGFRLLHPLRGEVWQLHRVTNSHTTIAGEQLYEITPQRLEQLLALYSQRGYRFVTIDEVYHIVKDHSCLTDEKFVAVTFDDGYADNLQVALPILERFQVPFCVYVTKQFIEQGHKCYTFLDQLQLLSLSHHPLCSIGCHTCSHPQLASLSVQEQKEEIAVCRDWLQQLIGTEVWHLAYPYGSYNADTLLLSDELGFRTAVAAWGGGLRKGVAYPLMAIPRCLVTENAVE